MEHSTSLQPASPPRLSYFRHLRGVQPWGVAFAWLTLAGATLLAYARTWQVPFLFDDVQRIVEEPALRQWDKLPELMAHTNRPFAMATFALNYAVHGYEVWGYHAVNLAIHIAAGLVLFGLIRLTLSQLPPSTRVGRLLSQQAVWIAWTIALLWLLHPLQTQAVTYIVQRLESLMGLAYLSTLYFFARGVRAKTGWGWLSLSLLACALGMGCKEVMVTAPLMVLWYDRVFVASSWRALCQQRWPYYCGLFATWGVLLWAMLHDTTDYTSGALVSVTGLTPLVYLWNQTAVLVHYLRLALWPVDQCFLYQWPVETQWIRLVPSAVAIVALACATVIAIFRWPRIGWVAGWFFIVLAPTSSIVPIKDLAFEHRMYLPLAGVITLLVIAAAVLLDKLVLGLKVKRAIAASVVFAVAGLLLAATIGRNHDYRSTLALWEQTARVAPNSWGAWNNYGIALAEQQLHPQAVEAFARAADINPSDVGIAASYAGSLIETGDYAQAETQLLRAMQLNANDYLTILNWGNLEFARGRFYEAVPYLEGALVTRPDNVATRVCLAACLVNTADFEAAEQQSREALRRDPNSPTALLNLACALGGQGRISAAIVACRAAIEHDPSSPNSHGTLGLLLADSNLEEAKAHFEMASALEAQLPTYDLALAGLLIRDAPAEAVVAYQAALKKQPDCIEAHLGLVDAHIALGQADAAIVHLEFVSQRMPEWTDLQRSLTRLRAQVGAGSQ